MEIKVIFIEVLVLFLMLISCKDNINLSNLNESNQIQNQWYIGLKDTVLTENIKGNYIKYKFQGDTIYSIEWGNEVIKNRSITKFEVLSNGVLSILNNNENCILLHQSCGISCLTYVFLPINKKEHEKVFLFAKAYDLKNNLVAFIPEDDVFIRVENFITGQVMDIYESNLCPSSFKGDCIESILFDNGYIIIKWQGKKWEKNKPDLQEKTIPLIFEK